MTDRGPWLQTFTGRAFYPLSPDPADVSIDDIAHSLSMQCRFTGHVRAFYSVAEHSVRVSRVVPPRDALWGLLHDASEAYLVDLCRPLKRHTELGAHYREIEAKVMAAICLRFGLGPVEPESVKQADRTLLVTEKRDLLGPEPRPWPWSPPTAKGLFMIEFDSLTNHRTLPDCGIYGSGGHATDACPDGRR